MALSTPLLYSIPAFDATSSHMISFTVSGGDQVVANRLLIKKNSDLSIVYNQVLQSYSFNHTIPANTLINGDYYIAQIKTYGVNDDITSEEEGSLWSSAVPFRCYTTPILTWTNKPIGSIIQESNYTFQFSYSQAEGEELYSYIINLYDNNQRLISTSGTKYIVGITLLTYEVNGLADNNTYYIEINGVTVNNTQISSGKNSFLVNYYEPYSTQVFEAKNDACNGWIALINNQVIIIPSSYPLNPIYVKDNTAVDVKQEGYYVRWSGLHQNGNFCIRIWGYDFNSNKIILDYSQNNVLYNLMLFRRDGYDYDSNIIQTYYELQIRTGDYQPYFIYSNYINQPSETDKIFICIKRIKNIYSLYIENLG